tara:strand:- start:3794 stop:4138 length:345 start_codon:yes stop_codon:yes gene_type:complete
MATLKQNEDGTAKWVDFEKGDEVFLGLHHGNFFGMNGEDTFGHYLGEKKGRHRFIREEGGEFHSYSCELDAPAEFIGEGGDDGFYSPAIKSNYDGKVPNGKPRDLVLRELGDFL